MLSDCYFRPWKWLTHENGILYFLLWLVTKWRLNLSKYKTEKKLQIRPIQKQFNKITNKTVLFCISLEWHNSHNAFVVIHLMAQNTLFIAEQKWRNNILYFNVFNQKDIERKLKCDKNHGTIFLLPHNMVSKLTISFQLSELIHLRPII